MSALGGREEMIAEGIGDADWSPDGKSIVGVARTAEGRAALARHVLETGRELLIARPAPSGRRLMRIAVGKPGTEVAVAGIPDESISPSVSGVRRGGSFRLAVVSGHQDVGLRLVDLQAPQNEGRITGDTQFCDASRLDSPGRFSPDF